MLLFQFFQYDLVINWINMSNNFDIGDFRQIKVILTFNSSFQPNIELDPTL
jgi:hypothetical protein